MAMLMLFLALVVVALLAPRYGVDSRPRRAGRRSTPGADLVALTRRLRRRVGRSGAR